MWKSLDSVRMNYLTKPIFKSINDLASSYKKKDLKNSVSIFSKIYTKLIYPIFFKIYYMKPFNPSIQLVLFFKIIEILLIIILMFTYSMRIIFK